MISPSTLMNLSLHDLNTGVSKLQIKGQIGLPPIFVQPHKLRMTFTFLNSSWEKNK